MGSTGKRKINCFKRGSGLDHVTYFLNLGLPSYLWVTTDTSNMVNRLIMTTTEKLPLKGRSQGHVALFLIWDPTSLWN